MSYKWLNGYRTELNSHTAKDEKLLRIADAQGLAERLGGDHTYLTIDDGTGAEIVKASRFGKEVRIARGQDGTEPKTFPRGACVKWEVTKAGLTETICNHEFECQLPTKPCPPCNCCGDED